MNKGVVGVVLGTVLGLSACGGTTEPGISPDNTAKPRAAVQETQAESPIKLVARKVRPGVIKVVLTNGSDKKLDVNPLYFKALDGASEEHQSTITGNPGELKTSMIAAGVKVSGQVYFETKKALVKVSFTNAMGEEIVSITTLK
ncbi:DUF4352 domain-containing protein [Spirillospora sp. NPDC047279]|uniref:DUF4352 domain-containing protein n=1 Tax=Spirillospora sp. NPDC047279 TaxID=3155478 RepID=UPI0033D300E4